MTEVILSQPGAVLHRDGRGRTLTTEGKRRYSYPPNGIPPLRERTLSAAEVAFLEEPTIIQTFKSDRSSDEDVTS
jgi:hypothetical protein